MTTENTIETFVTVGKGSSICAKTDSDVVIHYQAEGEEKEHSHFVCMSTGMAKLLVLSLINTLRVDAGKPPISSFNLLKDTPASPEPDPNIQTLITRTLEEIRSAVLNAKYLQDEHVKKAKEEIRSAVLNAKYLQDEHVKKAKEEQIKADTVGHQRVDLEKLEDRIKKLLIKAQ
jgi:hypothetical protein